MPSLFSAPSVASPDGSEAHAADAEPPIGLAIDVVHEAGDWGPIAVVVGWAQGAAAALAAELGLKAQKACLALSSDREVARLNAAYRGKRAPTNVLSFPAGTSARRQPPQARFLGDLVLAIETVRCEAAELGLPLAHHVQHLIVHGVLHLLGYDHEKDADAEAMEALEVRVLARLGIADPYAAADKPARQGHEELSKS